MRRKKIALIKQSMHLQGGLEKHTLGLAHAFSKRGFEVDILCQSPCSIEVGPLINLVPLSAKRGSSWTSLKAFDRALVCHLANEQYTLSFGMERHSLQTHYRAGSGVHRYYLDQRLKDASLLKKASLWLNPFHRLTLQIEKLTFANSGPQRIYTNSQLVKEQIIHYYKTDHSRIVVIHNGANWAGAAEAFEKAPSTRAGLCQKLSLEASNRFVCFVGHGFERKGLKLALHALALSSSRFHILIAGKDKHEPAYRQYAQNLGIGSRVHFLGQFKPADELYQISEGLILPTLYDPFANVTLEALTMGLHVITSASNGAGEIIHPSCGDIIDSYEATKWAICLDKMWQLPSSRQRRELIRKSVQHLEFTNQIEKIVDDALAHL